MNISLYKLVGESKLWGRETGRNIRENIIALFLESNDETLLIDFDNIEILDYSFASEVIGILISRLSTELKGKHLILSNLNNFVQENVGVALEKAELCALVINGDDKRLIGKCSEVLKSTFDALVEIKETDTPTLAQKLDTTVHTLNNRLKILINLGLADRAELTSPSGGKQYIYYSII